MNIGISYDHNGYEISQEIKKYLTKKGYHITDYNNKYDKEDDYPDYALKLCNDMPSNQYGILICGSGIGMSIMANKVKTIRCARVVNKEEAIESRTHLNANVIALSSGTKDILDIIESFITTPFSNEER